MRETLVMFVTIIIIFLMILGTRQVILESNKDGLLSVHYLVLTFYSMLVLAAVYKKKE